LKIALVIFHADPARGGAETYTADLAAALACRGHDVSILAQDYGNEIGGVEFTPLASRAPTRRGQYRRFLKSLDGHLVAHRYDVVHAMLPVTKCHIYHPHAGLAVATLARGHQKHSGTINQAAAKIGNQFNFKRRFFAQVEQQLLGSSNPPVVLCLSDYVKRSIRQYFDLPDEKLATLFNAVDLNRFAPDAARRTNDRADLSIAPDQVIALMVAQDFARKGLRDAILALAAAADKRLFLLVVGKGRIDSYQQLARNHGIASQVGFIGPASDPWKFYNAADFFVLPTKHDPCSLVVLESLAMGLPVISTTRNGACEIMQNGRQGYVLPEPDDVPALTNSMRQMLDAKTRDQMRQECISLRPSLSFDTHLDRLLAIYASSSSFAQKSTAR
jgi:UDP-glucose:(heptosyl)LPS alpha-1,3-glucosyltransferase